MSRTPAHRRQLEDAQDVAEAEAVHRGAAAARSPRSTASTSSICPPYLALQALVDSARGSRVGVSRRTCTRPTRARSPARSPRRCWPSSTSHGVVLGHSERRQYFGETDAALSRRSRGARGGPRADPVRGRDRGGARARRDRAQAAPPGPGGPREGRPPTALAEVVIAYEPSGRSAPGRRATPEQAQEAHAFCARSSSGFDAGAAERRPRSSTAARSSPTTRPSCSPSPTSTARSSAARASIPGLADAEDRHEPGVQRLRHLLLQRLVGLVVVLPALGVPEHDAVDVDLREHRGRDLAGERARLCLVHRLRVDCRPASRARSRRAASQREERRADDDSTPPTAATRGSSAPTTAPPRRSTCSSSSCRR